MIDARQLLHGSRVIGRQHLAFGAFERGITWREIESDLAGAPVEQEIRAGRFDAAQVVERVVLTRHDVAVGQRHALQHGDGLRSDLVEHAGPSRLEFFGREVGLIELRRRLTGGEHPDQRGERDFMEHGVDPGDDDQLENTDFATNQTFAGRSARRRMYQGNQNSP